MSTIHFNISGIGQAYKQSDSVKNADSSHISLESMPNKSELKEAVALLNDDMELTVSFIKNAIKNKEYIINLDAFAEQVLYEIINLDNQDE